MSIPCNDYDESWEKIKNAKDKYLQVSTQLGLETDDVLEKAANKMITNMRISSTEWLICGLAESDRDAEEKRGKSKAITKEMQLGDIASVVEGIAMVVQMWGDDEELKRVKGWHKDATVALTQEGVYTAVKAELQAFLDHVEDEGITDERLISICNAMHTADPEVAPPHISECAGLVVDHIEHKLDLIWTARRKIQ